MRTTKYFDLLLVLLLLAGAAISVGTRSAFAADPTNGTGYLKVARPQNVEGGSKVDVTEFFSFHCPHCYTLDPALDAWVARHKTDVRFTRVHVAWGEDGSSTQRTLRALQRAYYTLGALGKEAQFHKKLFAAFQGGKVPLYSDEQVSDFLIKQGVERAKYLAAAHSFSVESNMQRARQAMKTYDLDGVPNLVVDGRFVTSPSLASLGVAGAGELADDANATKVLDHLVTVVKSARPVATPVHPITAPARPARKK